MINFDLFFVHLSSFLWLFRGLCQHSCRRCLLSLFLRTISASDTMPKIITDSLDKMWMRASSSRVNVRRFSIRAASRIRPQVASPSLVCPLLAYSMMKSNIVMSS